MSNTIAIGTKTYTLYTSSAMRAEYIGPAHTDQKKQLLILSTQQPSKNASNAGARRTTATFVDTVEVPSACDATCKVLQDFSRKIYFSHPVGMEAADLVSGSADIENLAKDAQLVASIFAKGQLVGLGA